MTYDVWVLAFIFLACLELLYMIKIHSGYFWTACTSCSVSTCGNTIP